MILIVLLSRYKRLGFFVYSSICLVKIRRISALRLKELKSGWTNPAKSKKALIQMLIFMCGLF